MTRREFITLLGGAAAWPLAARAQQPAKPTIGFLVSGTPSSHGQWVAAFVQRLRELGWVEGRTIAIEYRWGEGRNERFAEIADELLERHVLNGLVDAPWVRTDDPESDDDDGFFAALPAKGFSTRSKTCTAASHCRQVAPICASGWPPTNPSWRYCTSCAAPRPGVR
jgi:hypothetical protein